MSARFMLQPGPTQVDFDVLTATVRPPIHHSDPAFIAEYDECCETLRPLFGASDDTDIILVPASGRGGLEAAVTSLADPVRPVMVIDTGVFSGMLLQILESLQIPHVRVDAYPGKRVERDTFRELLNAHQPWIVSVPQVETSTGNYFDTSWLADEVHAIGGLLMVDAVASLGGVAVNMQAYGIDIVVSGSQKALGGLTGVAMVALAPSAIHHLRSTRAHMPRSFYFDLDRWYKNFVPLERGGELVQGVRMLPWSMNTHAVFALQRAAELAISEGLEARFSRHARVAESFREALESLGFGFLDSREHLAPTLTVATPPEGIDAATLLNIISEQHGVAISGGLGAPWRGKVIRVGHMAETATTGAAIRGLHAIEDALETLDQTIAGDSVRVFQRSLRDSVPA